MSRKALGIAVLIVCAIGAIWSSVALAAQTNLYAWVEGVNMDREAAAYYVKPAEPVDVEVGEEIQVSLWIGNVSDNDRKVRASFDVAAGGDKIQITGAGSDWVRVRVKGGSGGLAQLAYEVDGDYNLAGGVRSGRITFEIE